MRNRCNRLNALSFATVIALGASTFASAQATDKANLASLDDGSSRFQRLLVTYANGSEPRRDAASFERSIDAAAIAANRSLGAGKALQFKRLRRTASGADVVLLSRSLDRAEAAAAMKALAADPNVVSVENDVRMVPYFTPNDSSFSQQYGFGSGAGGIRATSAWDVTQGAGAVVAVIDTGITNHSDLNGNVIGGYDFISGDDPADGLPGNGFFIANDGNGRDGNPSDPGDWNDDTSPVVASFCPTSSSSWHGSHVAGTVAAVTNNRKGVAGTAPAAKVVPVRVLGRCGGYSSDIADAITWASGGSVAGVPANPNVADVINLSLGSRGPVACPQAYKTAIEGAAARGTIVVVAAGNSGSGNNGDVGKATDASGRQVGYTLANCGTVISVGSVTSSGARSSFSNYGALVDVAAPGTGILSTVNNGTRGPTTEAYKAYNGTSMASPHVAGLAALIQSVAPTPLTQEQMRALLKRTARAFPVSPGSKPIGVGIVNADAAVKAARTP